MLTAFIHQALSKRRVGAMEASVFLMGKQSTSTKCPGLLVPLCSIKKKKKKKQEIGKKKHRAGKIHCQGSSPGTKCFEYIFLSLQLWGKCVQVYKACHYAFQYWWGKGHERDKAAQTSQNSSVVLAKSYYLCHCLHQLKQGKHIGLEEAGSELLAWKVAVQTDEYWR